mmetsp:Transcript_11187/g.13508  ORF Transcript_11187/g.13508 Transcript_11187/m.13508 type:complete len:212 (-) Transcript_11187:745-1380(-)
MSPFSRVTSLAVLLLAGLSQAAMTDPATNIAFSPKLRENDIFGVGVRKKGPIKVYSVGMYCSETLKSTMSSLSKTADKGKKALNALCAGAKDFAEEQSTSFLLQMNFKVGAEKMASAIADSVSPRHTGNPADVEDLKGLIFQGVSAKGAAVKGTTLQFDCSSSGVDVAVDGAAQGNVNSTSLAEAFCDVYLDDDCVSPAMRQSVLDNCCAP